MQELMSRHKAYALSPRDCLKTTLFQKWQRMVAPPGTLFFLIGSVLDLVFIHFQNCELCCVFFCEPQTSQLILTGLWNCELTGVTRCLDRTQRRSGRPTSGASARDRKRAAAPASAPATPALSRLRPTAKSARPDPTSPSPPRFVGPRSSPNQIQITF